ncbi:MAG: hypothetical protein ACT4TC_02680 [Myxococcaceae bacterium]
MTTLVLSLVLGALANQPLFGEGKPRLQGGWGFIWTSYGITWAALTFYALFLYLRRVPSTPAAKDQKP